MRKTFLRIQIWLLSAHGEEDSCITSSKGETVNNAPTTENILRATESKHGLARLIICYC